MKSWKQLLIVCCAVGALSACSTTTTKEEAKTPEKGAVPEGNVKTENIPSPTAQPETTGLNNTVYFDFDSDVVHPEDRNTIIGHAKLLSQNRGKHVTLEGYCDERGTVEYNMALGERRAKSVRDALMAQGVSGSQIKTVSYGESRPAKEGHDEAAWKMNRRVEFVE
ncbi:MAG: peptidoglycan-associated lipoprotein Pal [Gammaproteobacteria bacterium]|nr:peptidoglycan-associated lipoprotein Pal [Gammaproteobacteria bacterium]